MCNRPWEGLFTTAGYVTGLVTGFETAMNLNVRSKRERQTVYRCACTAKIWAGVNNHSMHRQPRTVLKGLFHEE